MSKRERESDRPTDRLTIIFGIKISGRGLVFQTVMTLEKHMFMTYNQSTTNT